MVPSTQSFPQLPNMIPQNPSIPQFPNFDSPNPSFQPQLNVGSPFQSHQHSLKRNGANSYQVNCGSSTVHFPPQSNVDLSNLHHPNQIYTNSMNHCYYQQQDMNPQNQSLDQIPFKSKIRKDKQNPSLTAHISTLTLSHPFSMFYNQRSIKTHFNPNDCTFSVEAPQLRSWTTWVKGKKVIYLEKLKITVKGDFCFHNQKQKITFKPEISKDNIDTFFDVPDSFPLLKVHK
jgi:hypothetical protein